MVRDTLMFSVAAVISSSSSEDVNVTASSKVCSERGRPSQQLHRNIHDVSDLLPIDEDSVGPVLEKLLAMMQSMSMLLSALKTDLRHSSLPDVQAKKRDAAITQLWRALVAYQKSFSEIEQFARSSKSEQFVCSSKAGEQTTKRSSDEPSQSRVKAVKNTAGGSALSLQTSKTPDVIEVSESDTESDEDPGGKRQRYDTPESVKLSKSAPVSSAAEEDADLSVENSSSRAASASTSDVSCDAVTISSDAITISSDEVWGMHSEGEPIVEFHAA